MKVLVTGGTGFIGQPLVKDLLLNGHEVTVLTRAPKAAASKLPASVTLAKSLSEVPGADAVINLAGESLAARRWTPDRKQAIRASRIDTTRALCQWLEHLPVRPQVLISGSAIGWYGARQDECLNEDALPGDDFAAQLCRDWEAEAERAAALGIRVCTIRIGVVLGPAGSEGGGALAQMLPPFKFGLGGPMGSGKQWMSWIHRADLIALIQFLLQTSSAAGPFNATAPAPVRNREFSATLGEVLHRPAFMTMPGVALRVIVGEMAEILLTGQRVVPSKAEALGFRFRHPQLQDALQDVLQTPRDE
jgi:uncharacterized protein